MSGAGTTGGGFIMGAVINETGWVVVVSVAAVVAGICLMLVPTLLAWGWRVGVWISHLLDRRVELRYGIYLAEASIGEIPERSPILGTGFIARPVLKRLLVARMLRTGQAGRLGLARLYVRLGFVEDDRAGLGSRLWVRRLRSCVALGLAGEADDRARLVRMLSDRNAATRLAAARSLARLGASGFVDEMIAAMESAPGWCAARMGEIVAGIGPAAFEPLSRMTAPGRPVQDRARIVEVLGGLGDQRAVPALMGLLGDPEMEVRIRSARALGRINDRRAAARLEKALSDPAWEVRAQAAKSIGALKDGQSAEALAACLDDKSWWVRFNSAHALASLGPEGVLVLEETASRGEGFSRDISVQMLDMRKHGVI